MSTDSNDFSQLPFLLRLIDDPSPRVREKVRETLRAFGSQLHADAPPLRALRAQLTPSQSAALEELLSTSDASWRTVWAQWIHAGRSSRVSSHARIESALDILARWQMGRNHPTRLRAHLDRLAGEFSQQQRTPNARNLALWLFGDQENAGKLGGAAPGDYYNPLNSNAVWAIENGRGLPITLSLVFMLTANRLDLRVFGCNFPNHFMTRALVDGRDVLFDPFAGRELSIGETEALRHAVPHHFKSEPDAEAVIARVLMNMMHAYRQIDDEERMQFVQDLLDDMQSAGQLA